MTKNGYTIQKTQKLWRLCAKTAKNNFSFFSIMKKYRVGDDVKINIGHRTLSGKIVDMNYDSFLKKTCLIINHDNFKGEVFDVSQIID